jgi:hypothetical protein
MNSARRTLANFFAVGANTFICNASVVIKMIAVVTIGANVDRVSSSGVAEMTFDWSTMLADTSISDALAEISVGFVGDQMEAGIAIITEFGHMVRAMITLGWIPITAGTDILLTCFVD